MTPTIIPILLGLTLALSCAFFTLFLILFAPAFMKKSDMGFHSLFDHIIWKGSAVFVLAVLICGAYALGTAVM